MKKKFVTFDLANPGVDWLPMPSTLATFCLVHEKAQMMNKNALKGKVRQGRKTATGKIPNSTGFPGGNVNGGGVINPKGLGTRTYTVTFQKFYGCSVDVTAASKDEAIELVRTSSISVDSQFIGSDYFEAEETEE